MTTCKYFLQGNCRFGQYCRFAHTANTNYGDNSALANKPSYTGVKTLAFAVAEEVLFVERGGQWPLSCFGPFKERPCIPGMEDFSPDEFHWEIYQAQKNGTVEQTKLQFQQLCQDMKAKRDLLKNPTQEIAAMLEYLQKSGQDNTFNTNNSLTKHSNFSFATPQLAIPSTGTPASNLFTSKPFNAINTSNPFGGATSTFGATGPTIFAFSSPTNSSTFGAKPNFGANPVFGGTGNPVSSFGTAVNNPSSVFAGGNQNASSFGNTAAQNPPAFNAQPVFGQSSAFGTSNSENTPFGRLQSTQSNTIFGGTTTLTNSVFGGTAPTAATTSIFASTQPATTSLFGGVSQQTASSIFGGSSMTGNSSLGSAQTSLFGQPKTGTIFGGGPVFGGAPTFGAQSTPGIFGGQSTFGSVPTTSSNVFGGTTAATPTFGSIGHTAPTSFSSVVKSQTANFSNNQNPPPFGSPVSTSSASPFNSIVSTGSTPFVKSPGPFTTATVALTPFSGANRFGSVGQTIDSTVGFGATPTQSETPFGTTHAVDISPFNQGSSFGGVPNSSPFSTTNTIVSTAASPFANQSQLTSNSPFVGSNLTSQGSVLTSSQTTLFANSPFASVQREIESIDESSYTIEGQLTDDEKAVYLAKQFTLGRIPLKPPTKELR
ncbi:nucleoporin NSP1-like isoform X1 [Neodiprion virginianus]|uniref:nucleoporin NSP1-like isoform X1 n=2 Tax=Neodiprion virginianus TaxID=2961670 RepID=UPI001EE716C8|nr:nucleoporin NSP1-like isoform X1 [Neodiprion virginianus]